MSEKKGAGGNTISTTEKATPRWKVSGPAIVQDGTLWPPVLKDYAAARSGVLEQICFEHNAHDALVALARLVRRGPVPASDMPKWIDTLSEKARHALALAEGEVPQCSTTT